MTEQTTAKPRFEPNGDTRVPAFTLPPSGLLSAEALKAQQGRAAMPGLDPTGGDADIAVRRQEINAWAAPAIAAASEVFPVDLTPGEVGGVEVLDITPRGGGHDPDRVLINLHGGAFCVGWDAVAKMESIPVAAMGGYRVVSVNYRMAPEHRHPAGVEDVAKVYAALLEDYAPEHIGIFGGSAGGVLTAQSAAWLVAHDLPQAGAIGIFGAGGVPFYVGESAWVTAYTEGSFPAPAPARADITKGYFEGCDDKDRGAWPAWHLDIMAKFPPTLIITGTRAMDLSPAIYTNSQLLKAGVRSTLIVGEGMGHCYYIQFAMPEARDALEQIVRFFRENLA